MSALEASLAAVPVDAEGLGCWRLEVVFSLVVIIIVVVVLYLLLGGLCWKVAKLQ